jgi:hypothetical protein
VTAFEPGLEFVFELRVAVADPIRVGRTASEDLNVTPIVGGEITGPRLTGRVLPVGADWWVTRGATTQLDARYVIEAEDGAAIDVVNRGYWHAGEDVERRLRAESLSARTISTTGPPSSSRRAPKRTGG